MEQRDLYRGLVLHAHTGGRGSLLPGQGDRGGDMGLNKDCFLKESPATVSTLLAGISVEALQDSGSKTEKLPFPLKD